MKSLSQGAGHNAHDQFYYMCCSSILQTPQRGAKRRLRLMMTQSCKFCFFPATFPNMSIILVAIFDVHVSATVRRRYKQETGSD
jgi:hypothetical protein